MTDLRGGELKTENGMKLNTGVQPVRNINLGHPITCHSISIVESFLILQISCR